MTKLGLGFVLRGNFVVPGFDTERHYSTWCGG